MTRLRCGLGRIKAGFVYRARARGGDRHQFVRFDFRRCCRWWRLFRVEWGPSAVRGISSPCPPNGHRCVTSRSPARLVLADSKYPIVHSLTMFMTRSLIIQLLVVLYLTTASHNVRIAILTKLSLHTDFRGAFFTAHKYLSMEHWTFYENIGSFYEK